MGDPSASSKQPPWEYKLSWLSRLLVSPTKTTCFHIQDNLYSWVRRKVVEMHSCVSANRQAFASGDFIQQSCLLRRKNASLHVDHDRLCATSRDWSSSRNIPSPQRSRARHVPGAGFPAYRSVMSRDCKSRLSGPTMTVTSPGSMAGRREAS